MKKITIILSICATVFGFYSCVQDDKLPITFEDVEKSSIYDYIVERPDSFSSIQRILEVAGIDKTLSAYNPNGDGYTMFLPDNAAIDSFLQTSEVYNSLDDLLADVDFVWYFARYHVVNKEINANDFPFGALEDLTLTEDNLVVNFEIEPDSSYYKINNQAPVTRTNIEMSNGTIHLIKVALTPVTLTTYGWLTSHDGFSIFRDAVESTGLYNLLNKNPKDDLSVLPLTLFLEPDSVYHKAGIFSFADLVRVISPGRADYNDPLNPLYNYVAYHILVDYMFLDDFQYEGASTNYATYSDVPVHVNGSGIDIMINKGKEMFDTIINGVGDTTFINYVGINYDASNLITKSGVIHFIDQVLKQQKPSKAIQTYDIYERPLFDEFRLKSGTYLVEDSTLLNSITYSGTDLFYVKEDNDAFGNLWGADYIYLDGDFVLNYTLPKLVQGDYTVFLQADFYDRENAVIEVYLDGKPIGGTIDLANDPDVSATAANPYAAKELADVSLIKYETHTITIKTLIPGKFSWDYIRFEPL
jgi:uncharacterized surface protein with fasciclin (FAS1) repeats